MLTTNRQRLNLEEEVAKLETELRLYKELKLTKIERRINELLDQLDELAPTQTKGERLRERIGIIAATVALTAISQAKFEVPKYLINEPIKIEQVSPKLISGLIPGLATSPKAETKAELNSSAGSTSTGSASEQRFADKVRQVATNIGADPVDLLTLMSFESAGTLSPSQRGPHVPGQGSAVGLIQFMPSTSLELGTTVEQLAAMTPVEQLDYVEKYLVKRGFPKGGTLKQLYSTVFAGHPHASGSISDGYHTLDSAVERMNREHRQRAIAILNGNTSAGKFADTKAIINSWSPQFQEDPKTGDIIAGYHVTSPRGMRMSPTHGRMMMHQGVDLGTPAGTPLYAPADGTIECDIWPDAGGAGLFTSPSFPVLRFDLLHLDSCVTKPGTLAKVKQGERIGTTGSWGTGPHLHLAIKSQESGKFLRVRSGWLYWFVTGKEPK